MANSNWRSDEGQEKGERWKTERSPPEKEKVKEEEEEEEEVEEKEEKETEKEG